ncbi:uncharacterized protein LOC107618628 isoform X3 [Arachis ipaensis]|uniref:uncharacterized protein LOC107618628 isoform X3 n=1 Tax=Arachis ipaensis TaxID=130454 RepID=UPI000A2B6C0F|nr:uncharacterized protein LOC107618628 isoform X3 [Arachis ipaensis]XP_025677272.1 uncharacterized protein LOC112777182 isoform X3 [Arachis hypogaea]
MSSTATLIGSISTTPHFSSSNTTTRTRFRTRTRTFSSTPQSLNHSFFRLTNAPSKRASSTPFHGFKRFSPVMEWQDCTVKTEVDVPVSVAYACYSDREAIPNWMPFISSVKILPDKPDLSRWSLNYKAFGRDIEFSWLARNMQPIPNQKIHWRSLEGLPNRGAVRFYPKGTSSCVIEALQPFLANLLERGLEQFARFAKTYT